MSKKGKRLTALMIFLFSFFSLIPANFNVGIKKAYAAETTTSSNAVTYKDANVFSVDYVNGNGNKLPDASNLTAEDNKYCEFKLPQNYIFIGVTKGAKRSDSEIITTGKESIENQVIKLRSINGIDLSGASNLTAINNILKDKLGAEISKDYVTDRDFESNFGTRDLEKGDKTYRGIVIKGLPFGVNKISYTVTETKKIKDGAGVKQLDPITWPSNAGQVITIYHGTDYVNNHVSDVKTVSYVGGTKDVFESQTEAEKENNKFPLKYDDYAKKSDRFPMIYDMDIPDSTSELHYTIYLEDKIQAGSVVLTLNGETQSGSLIESGENYVSGKIANIYDTTTLVIKYKTTSNNNVISRAYSIVLQPSNKTSGQDFRLKEAKIVKYENNLEDDVKAYIGKEFKRNKSESVLTYEGYLYVDPAAKKVSINPKSYLPEDKLIYAYDDDSNVVTKGNFKFVPITGNNQVITMNAYAVNNGQPDFSKVIVRYKFQVIQIPTGAVSPIKLDFDNTAYLTQPGVEGKKDFNEDIYSYNLYADGRVTVNLTSPHTAKNEYIRVWLGSSINSSNLVEVNASVLNNQIDVSHGGVKSPKLTDIDLGTNQKMIVKVYYDKKEYKDGVVNKITPSQIGHEYLFYIAKNIKDSDNANTTSNDASLKDLSIKDGKLKDTNGHKGFESKTYSYTAVVNKDAKSAEITPIANKDVESIIATVKETGDEYDMTSGKATKIPLNKSGSTTVSIKVLATDKVSSKTYTVVISNSDKSSVCKLQNLIVSPGDYTFDEEKENTKVRVDLNIKKVEITPIASDSKAKIYIDDEIFNEAAKTINLSGQQETEVTILVVSEDGSESKSYTVTITRRDADSVIDTSDDDDSDVFYDEYNKCWVDTSKYEEWGTIKGRDVYFDKKGRQVKDSWITLGKYGNYSYCYLDQNGYKFTGWLTDSTGAKYFLDQTTGEVKKGYLNQNNTWFYFDPKTGKMKTGWLYDQTANNWKYFLKTGQMVTNTSMTVDGKAYNFGVDGFIF